MSSSKSCHAFLSVAVGHLIFFQMFWVYQVSFEPLLGEAGHCGELPGPAPSASQWEKFPRVVSCLIPPDTSYEPNVFLILVYLWIFPHENIVVMVCGRKAWFVPDWSVLMVISFSPSSRTPMGMFTHISIHSVIFFFFFFFFFLKSTHLVDNPDMLPFEVSPHRQLSFQFVK